VHELSIAMSLIELATERTQQAGGARVEAVYLRIGALAGVEPDALRFSFEVAARDTLLDGARLVIEETPIVVYCARCQAERTLQTPRFECPACGAPTPTLVRGRELELTALEVHDDVPAHR